MCLSHPLRCIHCQKLEPHYAAAARALRTNDPPIPLGKVKVPDQMELAKRFGIGGYPLLLMFRYGEQYNYTGPREQEGSCTLSLECCVVFGIWAYSPAYK